MHIFSFSRWCPLALSKVPVPISTSRSAIWEFLNLFHFLTQHMIFSDFLNFLDWFRVQSYLILFDLYLSGQILGWTHIFICLLDFFFIIFLLQTLAFIFLFYWMVFFFWGVSTNIKISLLLISSPILWLFLNSLPIIKFCHLFLYGMCGMCACTCTYKYIFVLKFFHNLLNSCISSSSYLIVFRVFYI